ncbi:MAG: hypothetical protein GVX78_04225 [Bacteroidetes bacterium]|nr:hypothetical protein [Bacteroidota bacterium]
MGDDRREEDRSVAEGRSAGGRRALKHSDPGAQRVGCQGDAQIMNRRAFRLHLNQVYEYRRRSIPLIVALKGVLGGGKNIVRGKRIIEKKSCLPQEDAERIPKEKLQKTKVASLKMIPRYEN